MAEDRSWNRRSGWCLTHFRPDCERCRWADCECPGCVDSAKNKAIRAAKHPVLNAVGAVESGAQVKTAPGTLCANSESDSQGLAQRHYLNGAPD